MTTKNCSRTLKVIALIVPLLLCTIFLQEFLFDHRTYDTARIEQFYEEEANSLDVIFLGASEIFTGYAPGYAYDQYGFTSYMYAMDANQGSLYLSQLKEILKHQNPEILFVDIYGFLRADDAILFDEARLRIYTESIPFSVNKFNTIMEHPCKEKLSYFFPLIMYHGDPDSASNRLSETYLLLTKEKQPTDLKGAVTRTYVYPGPGDPGVSFDPATYRLTEHSKAYLVEFLDFCRDNRLDNIVFTNFPRYIADESNHSLLHLLKEAEDIVGEYGYPIWNLQAEMDAIGIERNQDYYNEHHMNIRGQVKLTDYLGRHIMNEYGLTPRVQSEENKLAWEVCASNTREFIQMATDNIQAGNDIIIFETAECWMYRQ